jgi:hypothetical protein
MNAENWSDQENDVIIAVYFQILGDELAGRGYNKAAHNRSLQQALGRSKGSIEFKNCNISAALLGFGLSYVRGYQPRFNFQMSLAEAISRWLTRNPTFGAAGTTADVQAFAEPRAAAEAVRAFLLLRLGLHLGLRQKNLRQLLVCPRGQFPTSERRLEDMKRGELRWSERDHGWEVLIPAVAFKNANSSFFGSKPSSKVASYNQTSFYEAWKLVIQRYGIFNPYTGRGVIKGLLPHGPHNVRDVLATHILKQTGSYEQASYAIQDTPGYGRPTLWAVPTAG